jgi:ABC-2 type transport system permease protein
MTGVLSIARRELLSYLLTPVGYVVAALFLFFTALVYFVAAPLLIGTGFSQGQPASMRLFFEMAVWVLFLIAPAISMRTISEELRLGTLETLLTAPIGEGQIILGKFAGAIGFLIVMLVPTLLFVCALELHGRPDYGEVASGYLGLVLVGAAFVASGILASTLTSSQVLAYVTTVFFWMILLLGTVALPQAASLAEGWSGRPGNSAHLEWLLSRGGHVADFLAVGNPMTRVRAFLIGLVDSFGIVYFISLVAVFLVAATKSLGMRRWP